MRYKELTQEAIYSGNLGMMEMMKFYAFATPEQIRRFKQLVSSKDKNDRKLANVMLQAVVGDDLQGDEFATEGQLNEIDYAAGIEPLQISFEALIANSEVVGDIDNREVYEYDDGVSQVYFTVGESVDGLIIMQGEHLHGIRNYSGAKGLITMLVGFVTHRLKKKVVITADEPLTSNGINWLCSLLKAGGRGLTITDQNGDTPDPDQLYKEWTIAMKSDPPGPTRITIESVMFRRLRTIQENRAEGRLMPALWFLGSNTL